MNREVQLFTHQRYVVLAGSVVVFLAGCASTDAKDELLPYGAKEIDRTVYNHCFYANSVSDWKPLDNENLIIFAPGRRAHHVQLVRPSFNLRSTIGISFSDRDGRICPYGGDAIVIGGGVTPERINIRSIKRISDGELVYLYDQFDITRPTDEPYTEEVPETEPNSD